MAAFSAPERVPLPFNIRLSKELVEDLDALAVRHQTTRSRIIRGLLHHALDQIKEGGSHQGDG
jgi:predicted transcriptional regulator